jgi:hypothetical protein
MIRGDRSVDVFVRKVRQKLATTRPEMTFVQTHYGVGYRFEPVAAVPSAAQASPLGERPGNRGCRCYPSACSRPRGDARAAKGSGL